jgi:chemotaxis-related protein WspB
MLALTFQIGPESLGLDIRRVREVIPRVRLKSITGSPGWFSGVFVYHGRVIPVIDLHLLTGHGECPPHLSSRIILAPIQLDPAREILVGLLAAHVSDLRDIPLPQSIPENDSESLQSTVQLGSLIPDQNGGVLRLLNPCQLLPASSLAILTAVVGGESQP